MNYKYKVTLNGIKGFYRVYQVNGDSTLYTFHKHLTSDLEFPMDQPILFKALDKDGNVVARWALVDLGAGAVDKVRISDTIKKGTESFVYFYDVASKKSVTITLEGEICGNVTTPTIIDSKGPAPIEFENGYVAFEDLPEPRRIRKDNIPGERGFNEEDDDEDMDEEDEEDEEDDDDEKEEIIYDENE